LKTHCIVRKCKVDKERSKLNANHSSGGLVFIANRKQEIISCIGEALRVNRQLIHLDMSDDEKLEKKNQSDQNIEPHSWSSLKLDDLK
jgi:hypothetical protein